MIDFEDETPQAENRTLAGTLAGLGLAETTPVLERRDITGEEILTVGPAIDSVDTTPSSDDPTLPQQIPGRPRGDGMESKMSQSYHEIFETQAYVVDIPTDEDPQNRHVEDDIKQKVLEKSMASGNVKDQDAVTPSSEDKVESENSGSTETGQPVIPKGDVYLRNGRLVSEDDTETSRQYLTSKLVADSLMWQQTFRNDSPSPEDRLVHQATPTRVVTNLTSDPALIEDIERQARRLASDVDNVIENLSCILQSISALTVETVETYRDGVCKTCDAVDENIKGMYQLMAKWEELNKSIAPAYKLSSQIKDIKRLLDVFEVALAHS